MKLVFVSHTPLAGMPYRTMRVLNRHIGPDGWARCIQNSAGYGRTRNFPVDLLRDSPEAKQVMQEADLAIVSAYMPDVIAENPRLPVVRHYSTEPFRWQEKEPAAGSATVVAQYQARFARQLDLMPNVIPIDEVPWMPAEKPDDRVIVVYTPTNKTRQGWGRKGYYETCEALRKLAAKHKDAVEILVLENRDYDEVMLARRHAHIVIDECATGSYHSTALEGLACGAVSVCFIDNETEGALRRMMGEEPFEDGLPFSICTLPKIEQHLDALISNPDLLEFQGATGRKWMETWYSEQWQASTWISWHKEFLRSITTS